MRKYSLLFCLLWLPFLAFALSEKIERIDIRAGLPNNFIQDIAQDQLGFLWFATEEGLARLEGSRFKVFLKNELDSKKGINANALNCVYADPDTSFIWIGTQREGMCVYDYMTDEFRSFRHDDSEAFSLSSDDITDIEPAYDGNLWICTYRSGVNYFDKKTGKAYRYNSHTIPGFPDNVWTVVDGGDGELYLGHVSQGFSVFSYKDRTIKNFFADGVSGGLPHNSVRSLCKDPDGNIWVGTGEGLSVFNPQTESFFNLKEMSGIPRPLIAHSILNLRMVDGELWVSTEDGGIYLLKLERWQSFSTVPVVVVKHLSQGDENNKLSNASIRSIYEDTYGNVWLGTWGTGINFMSKSEPLFENWKYSSNQKISNCLNSKVASALTVDKQGRVWVGTDGGGINVFKNGRRERIIDERGSGLIDNRVLSLLCDHDGNVWIGGFKSQLQYYDIRSGQLKTMVLNREESLSIRSLFEDSKNRLWIGCNVGVYVVDLKTKQVVGHYHQGNCELPENLIRGISEDRQGRMWIGTFGAGLAVFSGDMRRIEHFTKANGFVSNQIEHVFRDSKNCMWISTAEGLVLFEPIGRFEYKVFNRKDGLANSHALAVCEDLSGNIWFSTNVGLSVFINGQLHASNYYQQDGVPVGGFCRGSVAQLPTGELFFGSNDGVCYHDPYYVTKQQIVPPVIFTGLKKENQIYTFGTEQAASPLGNGNAPIGLSYEDNTFSIMFSVLDYSFIQRVEYAYRLKGAQESWFVLGETGQVTFRDLPYGEHVLEVKARLRNQEWPDEIASLQFVITPPFWKSKWAVAIYGLLFFALWICVLYYYKRRLDWKTSYLIEKQNHEKEHQINNERLSFFTNITHELRTPLTLILGPLEDLKRDEALSKTQKQRITLIHNMALRLLNLINQLLEFRKTETQNRSLQLTEGNLSTFVYEIGLKYKDLNRNPELIYHIEIKEPEIYMYFDRDIVMSVIDNLMSNASKYTPRGCITLLLERKNEYAVSITVSDTGYGISKEALPHIMERYYQENSDYQASGTGIGLALVKNLLEVHKGEIHVESTLGIGSRFTVILPLDLHPDEAMIPIAEEEIRQEVDDCIEEHAKQMILVVEDNIDIREYIVDSFKDKFEVIEAENGENGVQKAIQNTPDIIISDIMMPVKNGIALCKELKEDIRTSHIPIILLTAKDSLDDKETGYNAGADSYITKPFSAGLLQSRVANLLELRAKLAKSVATVDWSDKQKQFGDFFNQRDSEFLNTVTTLIENNLTSEKIDIGFLADKLCISSSSLYRKMKALTDLSTNEYIRKVRMKCAEQMLLEQKYSISEISYRVGIGTTAYFTQCFVKEFGLTPSQYLKKMKGF